MPANKISVKRGPSHCLNARPAAEQARSKSACPDKRRTGVDVAGGGLDNVKGPAVGSLHDLAVDHVAETVSGTIILQSDQVELAMSGVSARTGRRSTDDKGCCSARSSLFSARPTAVVGAGGHEILPSGTAGRSG